MNTIDNLTANERQAGDTPSKLLPLVYDKLRHVANARMAAEGGGQTLQPTALVHEAYLRLVKSEGQPRWNGPAHFFAAVTEIMRRILVEKARRRKRLKHGGAMTRSNVDPAAIAAPNADDDLLGLDEALRELAGLQPDWAELVRLRYFAGLTIPEAARVLSVSPRTADSWWASARDWFRARLGRRGHEMLSGAREDRPARC